MSVPDFDVDYITAKDFELPPEKKAELDKLVESFKTIQKKIEETHGDYVDKDGETYTATQTAAKYAFDNLKDAT